MNVVLSLRKTVTENADAYFEKAKKLRKKAAGARDAVLLYEQKLQQLKDEKAVFLEKIEQKKQKKVKKRPKKWYDAFRWFVSSEGFLVIAGRDATTNEIVIKKYTDAHDVIFHSSLAGSPFVVVKTEGKQPGAVTLEEAGVFCASFSKAWRMGLNGVEVYAVKPEQVSKQAKAGEYIAKGAFMIYGKKQFFRVQLRLALADTSKGMMIGPVSAIQKWAQTKVFEITQGNDKTSSAAKKIAKQFDCSVDDIVRLLPAGGVRLQLMRRTL